MPSGIIVGDHSEDSLKSDIFSYFCHDHLELNHTYSIDLCCFCKTHVTDYSLCCDIRRYVMWLGNWRCMVWYMISYIPFSSLPFPFVQPIVCWVLREFLVSNMNQIGFRRPPAPEDYIPPVFPAPEDYVPQCYWKTEEIWNYKLLVPASHLKQFSNRSLFRAVHRRRPRPFNSKT